MTEAGPAAQRDACHHPGACPRSEAARFPRAILGEVGTALLCCSASVLVDGRTARRPADSVHVLLGLPGDLPSSILCFILEASGTQGSQGVHPGSQ